MENPRHYRLKPLRIILFAIVALSLFASSACESKETKARKVVEERLKNQGVRELKVVFFHLSKNTPGKAYIAVDVTYNFATGEGNFQHEYLGYILRQEGQGWVIEKSAGFTKEEGQAENYIVGKKE
jgi:hypothetical protein